MAVEHPPSLLDPPAERHHDAQIGQPHVLADPAQRGALERKTGRIGGVCIARGAAKPEHRVLFLRLERIAAEQRRVFVGLEIRQADDDGLWIERGSDHAHALRQLLDEVVGRTGVIVNQTLNSLPCRRRCHLLRIDQRHRMDPNVLADDELHPRQADTVVRQHGGPKRKLRIAEIQHDGGARPLELSRIHPGRFEWNLALVHASDVPLGAGHRHGATAAQRRFRSRRSDHGGNAELTCNDGGMAGPPAMLRHDRGRDLHDRLPIRTGRFRHQNLARLEGREAVRVGNDPRGPDRDLLTDRSTGGQHRGGSLEGIAFERCRRLARGHRFGSSLDHVELSIIGIFGPFDIHRHRMPGLRRVMVLDRDRVVGKLEHFRVVDAEATAKRLRNGDVSRTVMTASIDHALLLAAERPAQDDAMALPEGRLVHVEFIGIDNALHNVLAQSVDAGNENHVAKAGLGIQGEDHAAGGTVGPDHLHDTDRERHFEMVESVIDSIRDGAISEDGGEAVPAGFE